MNPLNSSNFLKQLATFTGIAGVSSLMALPGIAELNPHPQSFNQSGDRVLELAQNSPNTPDSPAYPGSDINNNNNNGTPSDNAPNTPSNNNNPGRSLNTPTGDNSPSSLSSTDRNFVLQAAGSNMLEVQLGRLAVERGASNAVKQHGAKMVEEHTQVTQELMQLAMEKGVQVPTELSSQNKAVRDRLSGLSGTSFDAAYKQVMLDSHNQAIALFKAESQQGQDADVKAWATNILPNLQAHLQMINQMAGNTNNR
jgi:putative membrane protein